MNENLLVALIVIAIMIPISLFINFIVSLAISEWEKGMKQAEEERGAHFTLNPDMTISPGRPVKADCSKFENVGENGTIGPYGIMPDRTPIFDAQIYTKEDIECMQGGYGEGYGVAKYPWQADQPVVNVRPYVADCDKPDICGEEGPVGCSGNPNPPSADDIWNYQHGEFTPRQGDIMVGGCYSPGNMVVANADPNDVIITLNMSNNTMISLFPNGTILNKSIEGQPGSPGA